VKQKLVFFGLYTLFWLLIFIVCKFLFLFFFYNQSAEFPITDWFLIFTHGFRLDLSATGYILLIPIFVTSVGSFFKNRWFKYFINTYTILILLVVSLILITDLELYRYWGFRLDTTPLLYISTPREAFASVSTGIILRQILLGVLIFLITILVYFKCIARFVIREKPGKWLQFFVFLFLAGFLIIPIRGGFGIAPINTGSAYFHEKAFPNHAALNVFWNLGYSLVNLHPLENPYQYLDTSEAEKLFNGLYDDEGQSDQVLKQKKPNIIVIILESFSSKIIKVLGGKEGVTPQFGQLAREGILFKNFYATGDRTDKGLVGILSGYPAQPTYSIIKFPKKTANLPNITREFKNLGYTTSYYYGGSVDFANIRSYLVNSGFDTVISIVDFDPSTYNSKWGVHDHILLDRFIQDFTKVESPFFCVLMTLSSHEPFEVPMETVIMGDDEESRFLNSCYYTDKSIGEFISTAQKQEWWDNTLVTW
jgi:phosphoglycerol transferase MdoB-like AlkP superfamily enzyme